MIGELANHLWQSTLFAAAAGLLVVAFRGNRASVRYWLWFSASVKFLLPFALLVSLGSHLQWAPAATRMATEITLPSAPLSIGQISQPFPRTLPAAHSSRNWAALAIFGVWAAGFGAIALTRFRGWRRIRRALRASTPADIRAAVEVRSAPGLLEPGVVGWLHPVLLLPAGIADRLTPAQLQAVLAHELCHVRRRDNLWSSLHMTVEALFWFHPAVWWIGARLLEERERACDEEVLSLGGEPREYAEGILNVCKLYAESPLGCVSGVTGSNLKKRIEEIMSNRITIRLNLARKAVLAVAGICALLLPVVMGIMNAPRIRAQSAPAGTPKFETVSIQPGCAQSEGESRKSRDGRKTVNGASAPPAPGRLKLNCTTVASVIHAAYGTFASGHPLEEANPLHYVDAVPMSGGPAWIYTDRYQIRAQAQGDPSMEMMGGPMMQALLEDRFQVKVRRETREVPAYALTVADSGPKMQPFLGDCVGDWSPAPLPPGQRRCWEIGLGARKEPNFTPHFAPDSVVRDLDQFSLWLFVITDRPVVNKTGISGRFFMDLVFAPDQATPGALARLAIMARRNGANSAAIAPSNPPGPSIFTALEQQLGLKLEPTTAPRDFMLVDRVERPTAN
jgi:uncharacterized protein (TIGR03435 family)